MVCVVIHTNPHLQHQVDFGNALEQGFKRHGLDARQTAQKHAQADIHVTQGPHYALQENRHHRRVLHLDRCFYGDARWVVSLGWLRVDGSRDFKNLDKTEAKGALPELKEKKEQRGTAVVFADYGHDADDQRRMIRYARSKADRVYLRPHPAASRSESPAIVLPGELAAVWALADMAFGHSSTVLVDAEIEGLHVESTDPGHVVQDVGDDRQAWLNRLSWCQWSYDEVKRGAFWEHLCVQAD